MTLSSVFVVASSLRLQATASATTHVAALPRAPLTSPAAACPE